MDIEGKKRILVADDNVALSSVIRFTLERAGFDVTVAENGQLALDFIQESEFDLVVTDQQMPLLSGVEFCQRLRRQKTNQDIPVIMLTAKGLELNVSRLREQLGIQEVLLKPFSPAYLAKAVARHLAAAPSLDVVTP